MRKVRSTVLFVIVLLTVSLPCTARQTARPAAPRTPGSLVAELYRNQNHSPFAQAKSRALVDKYFDKTLADLIWKDAVSSKGEIGALDSDPLYDAQDFRIRNFLIHSPKVENGNAEVVVTFVNIGKKVQIVFQLAQRGTAWKITDIKYQDGRTLMAIYKEAAGTGL